MLHRITLGTIAVLTLFHTPLPASTITFEIVNANVQTLGGAFAGGGTYSGTFAFDPGSIGVPLVSADITTTAGGSWLGARYHGGYHNDGRR
jgi:hypothetical protein